VAGEKPGSRFAAEIAINTLLIYVKLARSILGPFVRFVGHNFREQRVIGYTVKRSGRDDFPRENPADDLSLGRRVPSFISMLSDRSYMQNDYPGSRTNAVTWLISAMVAVFILQFVFLRWFGLGEMVENALALSVPNIAAGRLWTLLSYSFLHSTSNLLHIFVNLLGLFFIGRVLEPMLGTRRFGWLFAGTVVTGAALWLATHWQMSGGSAIGASAGVAGLLVVYACFYPNRPMTFLLFFLVPVTLKPKYVAMALLAVELIGFSFYEIMHAASPFGSSIAHSAHLGGMLAGWIYFRYVHTANWGGTSVSSEAALPRWMRKTAKPAPAAAPVQVEPPSREDLKAEVDRILDKINSDGFGALTADEKQLLDDARDALSRR
jgi:membrane associated rhomboid family serine protease